MLKITLLALLYGVNAQSPYTTCPEGTGDSPTNRCVIVAARISGSGVKIIDIPETIKYATIVCRGKGCEKNIYAFLGAKETIIECPDADACLGSHFYCARGPPGCEQDDYDGDINGGVQCTLQADGGVSSVAKETEFVVFKNGKGIVRALGDVAFGTAHYRCYSDSCDLYCASGACSDTDITEGDKPVNCVASDNGDGCQSFKSGRAPLFRPIIAEPVNGHCEISDTGVTDSKTQIVFKNNCKTAKLDCSTTSTNCQTRKIYCAAQERCDIVCGGPDLTKPNEVAYLSGKCKEAKVYLGPILFDVPYGTSETDFDSAKKCTPVTTGTGLNAVTTEVCKIAIMKSDITLVGSDAMAKAKVQAVNTDVNIDANGGKTFGEGTVICGFDPKKPDNRVVQTNNCTLKCTDDPVTLDKACEKCRFIQRGGNFVDQGMRGMCNDFTFGSNRIGIKQSGVAGSVQSVGGGEMVNVNNGDNIVIPVNGLLGFAIIFATLTFIVTMACCAYKKSIGAKDKGLLKYGTMTELENVQTTA